MNNRTVRQILVTAGVIFLLGSCLPVAGMGCLHHNSIMLGLPVPWITVDVKYGRPKAAADSFRHGNIEKIEGIHVIWAALPVSLAGTLLLSTVVVGIGKGMAGAAKGLRGGIRPEGSL